VVSNFEDGSTKLPFKSPATLKSATTPSPAKALSPSNGYSVEVPEENSFPGQPLGFEPRSSGLKSL
jgi:hypothetical protein